MFFVWMYRGVHLKDLISLNTALSDRVDDLINFRKMVQLSFTFSELMHVHHTDIPVEPNTDLINTIRVCPPNQLSAILKA